MNSNQLKSINGYNNNMSLLQLLKKLQDDCTILYCESDYRIGYTEFDSSQFFAPFKIEFLNGEAWLIFASTSIRNDRMNNQQWNSYHIRALNPKVKKAFLIMPDKILDNPHEHHSAESYNKKIDERKMFSSIDAVLTQSQLIDAIIRYSEYISKLQSSRKKLPDINLSDKNLEESDAPYGTSISGSKIQL